MAREEIFRERLRGLRSYAGLSQQRAADGIGMTKVGYQNYESGRQTPNFIMLPKIATFFKVSADYLLGLSDEPRLPDAETLRIARAIQAMQARKSEEQAK